MAGTSDSQLKQAIRRLEAAMELGAKGSCRVLKSDVGTLFEAIKRYGGRRDWEPTWPDIDRLPGPVRRHIYAQHVEIQRMSRRLIDIESIIRKMEEQVEILRHPPR